MRQKWSVLSRGIFGFFLFLFFCLGLTGVHPARAATALNQPLDKENPVYFYGETIEYQGTAVTLDASHIYIDGSLSDEICAKYDHVYNDFKEAYESGGIKDGTEAQPMQVYLAPWVYWIDDPDDEAIREGVNGDKIPYGLWMNCNYLSLNGLTDDPQNVVLAVNRGQNAGAKGNFTMFYINGTGTHTENLTMGNYCCMDLVYPLKAELGREKRQAAITQSQLCLTNGRKITADNCNFVSRLNSCPFVGGDRILFTDCHFECTDDSLPTGAFYVNCNFDFYSPKPFYSTSGSGSVFMGCDFYLKHTSAQYLTKAGGTVTIVDSTFHSTKKDQYIGWTPDPSQSLRCYEGNVAVEYEYTNDAGETVKETVENYNMDADAPYTTVNITGTQAMNAYMLTCDGKTVYNVYNLIKGTDDYDPLHQKELLAKAGEADGTDYTDVPVGLLCSPQSAAITTGGSRDISTSLRPFSGTTAKTDTVTWEVENVLKDYITVTDKKDGTCTLTCNNEGLTVVKGMVYARGASGLVGGVYVTAQPKTQPAPEFVRAPQIQGPSEGKLTLDYLLTNDGVLDDYSEITWYRCSDAAGNDNVQVAVSRNNTPRKEYTLGYGDVGYYIRATIVPKELCTEKGTAVTIVSPNKITLADVTASPFALETDFSDFAVGRQAALIPGFWVRDVYKAWLENPDERVTTLSGWDYGEGAVSYGAEGVAGLKPTQRGSRILYVPPAGTYGDMDLTLAVNPEKSAGQGFGSAGQYMDVYIKFDPASLTGYALRLERVSDLDCGVQASLVKYEKDTVTYISDKVRTSAFNSTCTIQVSVKGEKMFASITTTHEQSEKQIAAGLAHSVNLEAGIAESTLGGTGVLITGTAPDGNKVMLSHLTVNWDEGGAKLEEPEGVDLSVPSGDDPGIRPSPSPFPSPDTPEQPDEEDHVTAKPLKTGSVFKSGKLKYKVTSRSSKTVEVNGVKNKKLTGVVVGGTVSYKGVTYKITSIGKKAFAGCKKLKKITIKGKNLKKAGKNAFQGIHKKCVIKVPASKYKAYKKLLKGKGQAKTVKIKK